jgi:SpoIID/LytB domain protein
MSFVSVCSSLQSSHKTLSPLPLFAGLGLLCAATSFFSGTFKTSSRAASTPAHVALMTQPIIRLAARTATPRPVEATVQKPRVRWVRVGLKTEGAPIALLSSGAMTISDANQTGRKLAVKPNEQVTFFTGPSTSIAAKGRTFSGPITIRTDAGNYGAWQVPRISTSGSPTHVSTNGESPRYSRAYRGHFEVAPLTYTFERATHKGNLRLVNIVPLEEYLKGVVPWEMNGSAPLEALKAQAICARSETMSKILSGRHARDGYDMCDYDHCQGYPGTENETARTTLAVEQTKGLVIYHNGQIADAVYGTNSGGITASSEDVWRGPPEPYLKSKRDFATAPSFVKQIMTESDWAKYCTQNLPSFAQPKQSEIRALASRRASSPRTAALFQENDLPEFYRWTRVINPYELAQAAGARAKAKMDVVTQIRIAERAPSGHIKKLILVGNMLQNGKAVSTSTVTLEGDAQVRAMLSGRLGSTTALPSSTFVVFPRYDSQKRLTAFVLKGAGWGHGVGMCQRGAQNRALAGWNARQIIQFYFHDVQVRKMH